MPSQNRASGEQSSASQPFTSEQTDIYLQGQRLTAFVSDYIVEATPQKVRREHGVEVQSTKTSAATHKGPKELRTLRPNQYLVLVRYLLNRGGLQVPRHVLQALKSLIRIRKVVCSWFQDAEDPQTIGDNEKHQHFIVILERVNQLLSPYEARKVASQKKLEAAEDEVKAITTVFAHLEDVEADDGEESGPSPSEEELQTKAESAIDVFYAESGTKFRRHCRQVCETNWMLHQCFLMRAHIQQKWRDVREGCCDLGSAAFLTNTAVEIAERMQKALFEKYSKDFGDVSLIQFYREHLSDYSGGKQRSGPTNTDSASKSHLPLFNFRAAWGLSESLVRIKHERILEFYLGEKFQLGLKDLRHRFGSGEWGEDGSKAGPQARAAYAVFCDSHCWDQLEKNYPHRISRVITSILAVDHEKYDYCPELLKELEEVFDGNLRECTETHPCHTSVEDYVLKTLRDEVAAGDSSLPGAFALALFVDIRDIMGLDLQQLTKVDRAAERLVEASDPATQQELEVASFTKPQRTGPNSQNETQLVEDPVAWFGRSLLRGRTADVQPDSIAALFQFGVQGQIRDFLRQSPLACGRLELFLRHAPHFAGTVNADARETIKSCLHFYNAAYQLGDIDCRWPDMERLIALHGCETLFLGPSRPVTLEECIDRWRRVFAVDVDLKGVYAGRGKISKPEERGSFANNLCPLLSLLGVGAMSTNGKYWRKAPFEDIELALSVCQRHPNQNISITPQTGLDKKPLMERLAAGRRRLEPLQLLGVMEQRLKVEESVLDTFDYLQMEQLCQKMLSRTHSVYMANKIDMYMGSNSHIVHEQGRGKREFALLSTPLFQFATMHDGIGKDLTKFVEKRVHASGSRRSGARRGQVINPLVDKFRQELDRKRKPYDTSARIMRQHIRRHGNDVTGVDGRRTREARHWVAVGNALMLHTSPRVSKAVQRDELGTGRKCTMMLP